MATTIQQIELPKKARAVDTSGNNNHGQIYSGRGLEFDGVSDYLTTGEVFQSTFRDSHTISFWIKPDDGQPAAYMSVLGARDATGADSRIYFNIQTTGKISFYYEIEGTAINAETALAVFTNGANSWHRVVGVVNNTTNQMHVYVNGVDQTLDGTNDGDIGSTDLSNYTSVKPLFIGGASNDGLLANIYAGLISDVQIWDTAWSAADVTYDYLNPESLALNNSGTALTESNLKLWYPMQDGHRGQQSYILDGANTGAGSEMVTNGDFSDGSTDWTTNSTSAGTHEVTFDSKGARFLAGATGTVMTLASSAVVETGKNYRLEVVVSNYNGSSGVKIDSGLLSNTLTFSGNGTHVYQVSTTGSGQLISFYRNGSNVDLVIESVSLKAINDKNHATTVFHGDEMWDGTQGDDANWSLFGNNTKAEDAGAVKITYVDNASGGYIMLRNATDLNADLVVGRTYIISFSTKVNQGSIAWRSLTSGVGGVNATATAITSTSFETRTMTVVANHATDLYIHSNLMATGDIVWIKDISVKEIGVASGWTDADQQLHIPQTALQSYNELAWFDGTLASDGYVDLDSAITTSGNNWSLSFWVFHDDNGQGFDFIAGNGNTQNITLKNNTTNRLSYRDGSGSYHAISDAAIPESEWVNITITATANTSITAYVNGVAQATNSTMTSTTLLLKRFMGGIISNLYHVLGAINEISYYSDVLTAAEALDLFNDGKAKSALEASGSAGLVGYWRNNGLSEWKDLKGSNDGNTSAGVTETILIPQGVDSTRDAQGFIMNKQKSTSCLNLSEGSSEDYVLVKNNPTLQFASGGSVGFWMKPKGTPATVYTILNNGAGGSRNPRIRLNSNLKINFFWEIADGTNKDTDATSAVTEGEWTYVVCTWDGTTNKIYLNDALDKSEAESGTPDTDTADLYIGKDQTSAGPGAFKGYLDGITFYSDVLSLEEVQRNYKATKGNHRN